MPFYSKVNSKNHEMPDYEMIYNPGTGSYMFAHRCTFTPKWEKGTCIHHCDFDKLNNDPDNLLKMTNKIHKRLHDENITPELIEARRQGLIKHYLMHVKSVGGVSTKGKTLEEIYGKERANEIKNKISKNQVAWLKGKNLDNCPQLVELAKQHSIRLKKFYKTEKGKEVLQRVSETRKRRIASGEIKVISGEDHPQYGKTWAELYTPEQIENRIKKITAANKARALVKNHKVV
ncbi:MAG: HNH endonuclease, partial [Nitrosopumilus sp.]